jgi:uncharacterized membrane protein YfcA
MAVGSVSVAMIAQSYMREHGRRPLALFIVLAIVAGLIVGWALNAWIDYSHITNPNGL